MIIKNPVVEEGLIVLQREEKLHRVLGFLLAFLTFLILYTGPKKIIHFVQTSDIPIFHLFIWFGIIIGFIGMNLYWAGDRDILLRYSSIRKWFSYTEVTPFQFCAGKIVLCCIESFIFLLIMSPLMISSMILAGFALSVIIPVVMLLFINALTSRIISVYFHSTYTGKKFPFSLHFLLLYFLIIMFYLGTFFLFPYANIFSVLLTLEPSAAFLFEPLVENSLIHIPFLSLLTKTGVAVIPVWLFSFSLHLILIFIFIFIFSVTLIFIKRHQSKRPPTKFVHGTAVP
ncbi:MAG: hypothetical protein JXJ04_04440 [Spirochaetales bacterium]|nr:hypothetical protein [Spirochaetales bacterium]